MKGGGGGSIPGWDNWQTQNVLKVSMLDLGSRRVPVERDVLLVTPEGNGLGGQLFRNVELGKRSDCILVVEATGALWGVM